MEYDDDEDGIEENVKRGEVFTDGVEGEHFDEDGMVYWRRKFPLYKIEYLRDYSRCKKMCDYIIKNDISLEEVVMNPELMPSIWVNTTQKRRRVEKKRKEIEKERRVEGFGVC